jgi:hypothetical protein
MKIFTKATSAQKPKSKESQNIAYMYAAILVIFAVAQLFTFDNFLILIESFWMPGGKTFAYLLGSSIVVSEVLAIPFLLQIKLSPLMRIISMVMSWLVPLLWFIISIWLMVTINAVSNFGLLGTTVDLLPGWWTVFISIALGVLAAWASWGLWPCQKPKSKKLK